MTSKTDISATIKYLPEFGSVLTSVRFWSKAAETFESFSFMIPLSSLEQSLRAIAQGKFKAITNKQQTKHKLSHEEIQEAVDTWLESGGEVEVIAPHRRSPVPSSLVAGLGTSKPKMELSLADIGLAPA